MGTFLTIIWAISFILWTIPSVMILMDKNEHYEISEILGIILTCVVPILNTACCICVIYLYIRDYSKERKEKNRILKERKEKIDKGLIKITINDPYGEENWND